MTCRGNVKFTVDAVSCEKSVDGIGFAGSVNLTGWSYRLYDVVNFWGALGRDAATLKCQSLNLLRVVELRAFRIHTSILLSFRWKFSTF